MGDNWLGRDEEVGPPPVFAIGTHQDVLDSEKEKFPNSDSVKEWLMDQGKLLEESLSDSDFKKTHRHTETQKRQKFPRNDSFHQENFPNRQFGFRFRFPV